MEKQLLVFTRFLADLLGPDAEIVLHDMQTGQVISIENAGVSERHLNQEEEPGSLRILRDLASTTEESLVGYRSLSKSGKPMRSSNLFIRDDDGTLLYIICVNQDISGVDHLQKMLTFLSCQGTSPAPLTTDTPENTVEGLTTRLIFQEMANMHAFSFDSKEARMEILKRLDEKGVFEVRRAVPKVCELLNISQATLYNYLKEIRK